MSVQVAPTQLGQNILVIMDTAPGFLDALRSSIVSLPQITQTFFTLFCYHPTHYWEHGGTKDPQAQQQIENVWKAKDQEFDRAKHCLDEARTILQEAGVPDSHILIRSAIDESSLITATIHELKRHRYSGVIISHYHDDVVNRLMRKGLTDAFRKIPKVQVWPIELAM